MSTAMMTKRQVKVAMAKAGIIGELTGSGERWQVELADESTLDKFCVNVTSEISGYRTGYGAYVMSPNYRVDDVNFNHVGARDHY